MGCHYLSRNQKLEYRSNPRILIPTTWELLPTASTSNSTHPPADTEDEYCETSSHRQKEDCKIWRLWSWRASFIGRGWFVQESESTCGMKGPFGYVTQAKDIVLFIIINCQVLISFIFIFWPNKQKSNMQNLVIVRSNGPCLGEFSLTPFETLNHSSRFDWITTRQAHQPSEVGLGPLQY